MRFRNVIILGMVLILGLGFSKRAQADDSSFNWSRDDHKLHVTSTFGISLATTMILRKAKIPRWQAVLFSSLGTMAFAYGKEKLVDPEYQRGDMIANSIGVATQALVVFSFGL
ncbi:MAG: hypothetical protein ACKN9V_09960 [Pseudomonadota bacterium]